jgi:hypothetical protein
MRMRRGQSARHSVSDDVCLDDIVDLICYCRNFSTVGSLDDTMTKWGLPEGELYKMVRSVICHRHVPLCLVPGCAESSSGVRWDPTGRCQSCFIPRIEGVGFHHRYAYLFR